MAIKAVPVTVFYFLLVQIIDSKSDLASRAFEGGCRTTQPSNDFCSSADCPANNCFWCKAMNSNAILGFSNGGACNFASPSTAINGATCVNGTAKRLVTSCSELTNCYACLFANIPNPNIFGGGCFWCQAGGTGGGPSITSSRCQSTSAPCVPGSASIINGPGDTARCDAFPALPSSSSSSSISSTPSVTPTQTQTISISSSIGATQTQTRTPTLTPTTSPAVQPAPGGNADSSSASPPGLTPTNTALVIVGVLTVIIICAVVAYCVFFSRKTLPTPKLSPQRISEWGAATRTGVQESLNPLKSLAVGSVVVLKGLMSTPELNGMQGKVLEIKTSTGRVSVALLSDPSRVLAVKPDCLEYALLPSSSSMQPPPPSGTQVFTSPDGRLYTYNTATGESIWLSSPNTPGATSY